MEKIFYSHGNIVYLNPPRIDTSISYNDDKKLGEVINLDPQFIIPDRDEICPDFLPDSDHSLVKTIIGGYQIDIISLNGISSYSAAEEITELVKENDYKSIIIENESISILPQVNVAKRIAKFKKINLTDIFLSPFSEEMINILSRQVKPQDRVEYNTALYLISSHLKSIDWGEKTIESFMSSHFHHFDREYIADTRVNKSLYSLFIFRLNNLAASLSMELLYRRCLSDRYGLNFEENLLVITSHSNLSMLQGQLKRSKLNSDTIDILKKIDSMRGERFANLLS